MIQFIKLQDLQDFLSRLSKRERLIFYGAAFFVSLAFFDFLILSPVFSKINSLDTEIRQRELGIKKNLHILAQKDRITVEKAKYVSFSSLKKSDEEEITALLKEIEKLADKHSVYLVDMKPADAKGKGSSNKFYVNLNCEAQMEQIVSFMYGIENSDELLTVDKYQINPKSKDSSIAKCAMSICKVVLP
jgi:Tfp pilus assembly protein PilO